MIEFLLGASLGMSLMFVVHEFYLVWLVSRERRRWHRLEGRRLADLQRSSVFNAVSADRRRWN